MRIGVIKTQDIEEYLRNYKTEEEAIKELSKDSGVYEETVRARVKLFKDRHGGEK